jgi:hypothetical protein
MVRVCPKRDAVCPHGMDCPFVVDKYECKPEPRSVGTIAHIDTGKRATALLLAAALANKINQSN